MQLTNGTELKRGDYRIIDVLGQGGFGITYLALQVKLNRKLAIKEFFMKDLCNRDDDGSHVSVGSAGSKDLVERFKQKFLKEAGLIASFDNTNIIRIYDVFEENGTAYYVMEYLEGKSLKRLVDESGALPEDVAVKYIRQVAGALKEVHENNLLHLDVKPANIMLDKKGNAVLIDFGISKHYDEAGHQTSSAGVGISEGYAPIEQYEAGALKTFTPVTDIYALGATLFFLLTGTRPPKASEVMNIGLPALPGNVSPAVRNAVETAMQPATAKRPQSVKEFIALLENQDVIVGSEETEVAIDKTGTGQNTANGNAAVEENEIEVEVVETPSVAPEPAPRPQPEENQKKNKWLWIIILLAIICGAAGGFMFRGGGNDDAVVKDKEITVAENTINGHEYVDLGLSVKWATCNVGASKPEEYGNHYAWGETFTKSSYTTDNSVTWGKKLNDIGGDPQYDVARKEWGSIWRLPTKAEFEELLRNCTWTWTTLNGINGCKVTSKKNGNSIFLPAAGWRDSKKNDKIIFQPAAGWRNGTSLYGQGTYGKYWSSTPRGSNIDYAYKLNFNSGRHDTSPSGRYYGMSVRPVSE